MASNETKVLQFCEMSGSSVEDANKFLEANGWALQPALNLYFTDPNMFQAPAIPAEPEVRAPLAASFQTLAGPQGHLPGRPARREPFRDYSKEWTRSTKQDDRGLANLFAPPSYVYKGDMEQACIAGMEQEKWMLVNIQSSDEFASHVLNRDIWKPSKKNEVLVPLIKEKFLFIQRDMGSSFARSFQAHYKITKFPSLCIIHPITRELVMNIPLENIPKVADVVSPIIQFIEKNPVPSLPNQQDEEMLPQMVPERRVSDMSVEDEEMAKAIAMSMQNSETEKEKTTKPEETPEPKPVQKIYPAPKPEPSKGNKDATSLRISLPNGTTIKRRFLKSDKVEELYAVVEHEYTTNYNDLATYCLIMPFPKLTLGPDKLSNTLQELGLLRCNLNMSEMF